MALLCVYANSFEQKLNVEPYNIGERVNDLSIREIINFKDSTATLSSFGHKLIILDFWHTQCSTCIAMFPLEDSLQHIFNNDLQFVLVTAESKRIVQPFIQRWDSVHSIHLTTPIVTGDYLLNKMFKHLYNPHYVWLAPDGTLLAQTSQEFINKEVIAQMLSAIRNNEAFLKAEKFPNDAFNFPPLTDVQKAYLQNHTK